MESKEDKPANRMKGMRIRDEFICPITYELLRDPVVASDGHTYERSAIEKWLKSSTISPRSGEEIGDLIIPNTNLKKLVQDIIHEGGVGFYIKDTADKDRLFDVKPEKTIILECLGPPETDWNKQSFQVTHLGCIGGRKNQMDDDKRDKDIILFKDITVSRKHFEISSASGGSNGTRTFYVRDLGSAGGTYIRIPFGVRKQLHIGMIVLVGKHQFTVSSIDEATGDEDNESVASKSKKKSEVLQSLVDNTEKIISNIPTSESSSSNNIAILKSISNELNEQLIDERLKADAYDTVFRNELSVEKETEKRKKCK